jgi:hypothetical protein
VRSLPSTLCSRLGYMNSREGSERAKHRGQTAIFLTECGAEVEGGPGLEARLAGGMWSAEVTATAPGILIVYKREATVIWR